MRLNVTDDKDSIMFFLYSYLDDKLNGFERKFVVNGREFDGVVEKTEFDSESFEWIKIHINGEIIEIPFNNNSIVRLDKGLYFFETDSHTTLIYL